MGQWSEDDGIYIGRCPDLMTGIHGDDPVQLYAELDRVIDEFGDRKPRARARAAKIRAVVASH
jgi:hypothetical protein